jgi:phosphopantothenoylcysteine decarboxylase/phosphopantothenate--cysteine ligase
MPRILITAGPTHEPIDRVRYIANRSSGRMGIALADAAAGRNWPTTLLLGPTALLPGENSHLQTDRFQTTAELQALLTRYWPLNDILIMAAAVADYRPLAADQTDKLKRSQENLTLELEPTPDLLAGLAPVTRPDQRVIGFALEPQSRLEQSAIDKLQRKRVDAIIANPLETMNSATVNATVYLRDGSTLSPRSELPKDHFAEWVLDEVVTRLQV